MKLLFDENLSPHLAVRLAGEFPGSVHVRAVGLQSKPDGSVWEYAKSHGLVIVSKDADFLQRSLVLGAPPKVVALMVGNSPTPVIESLLRQSADMVRGFVEDPRSTLLVLP